MQTSLWPSATGMQPFVGICPTSPASRVCQYLALFLAVSVNALQGPCLVPPRDVACQHLLCNGNCWLLWLWFLFCLWPRGDAFFISWQSPQALVLLDLLSLQSASSYCCWKAGLATRWDDLNGIGPDVGPMLLQIWSLLFKCRRVFNI